MIRGIRPFLDDGQPHIGGGDRLIQTEFIDAVLAFLVGVQLDTFYGFVMQSAKAVIYANDQGEVPDIPGFLNDKGISIHRPCFILNQNGILFSG